MEPEVKKEHSNNGLCWNDSLHCHWDSWKAINEMHLVLVMPPNNVPDMSGAIKIAKLLSPNVERIDAYSEGNLKAQYRLDHFTQKWRFCDSTRT